MSDSAKLQASIETRLRQTATDTLGDGVATDLHFAHGLNLRVLPPLTVKQGDTTLVRDTDYTLTAVDKNELIITALGGAPALDAWAVTARCLRVDVPIVKRRKKDLASDIEATAAKKGLGILIMPPLPTRISEGLDFIFVECAEARVQILETPSLNAYGADAYDLLEDVMACLHWQQFAGLQVPLQVRARQPVQEEENQVGRILNVILEATYA